ncbi:hypothetical protein JCM10450v2_003044 [Rhodotorula kratochvilovae]
MPALADLLALLRMDEKPLLRSVVDQGFATSPPRRSRVDAVVPLSLQPDAYVYVPELPQMLWSAAQGILVPVSGVQVDDELVCEVRFRARDHNGELGDGGEADTKHTFFFALDAAIKCAEPVNNALGTPRALRYCWGIETPAATPKSPSFPTRFDVVVVDGVRHGPGWRGEEGNAKLVVGEFTRVQASSPEELFQRVQRELEARVVASVETFAERDYDAQNLLKLAAGATFAETKWLIWYDALHYFLGYRLVDPHDPSRYNLLVSRLTSVVHGGVNAAPSVAEALLAIMLDPQIEAAAVEAYEKAKDDVRNGPYKPHSPSPEPLQTSFASLDVADARGTLNIVDRSGRSVLNARLELVQAYDPVHELVTSSDQTPSIPSLCFEEISPAAAPSPLRLATSAASNMASSATSSSYARVQPPAELTLVVTHVLHGVVPVRVWGAEGYPGYHEVAVKVVRASRRRDVQRELAVLRGPLLGASDLVVPMLAVYATPLPCGPGEREHIAVILEFGGESPREWGELDKETRLSLFLALVRIHQEHAVAHNDVAPRNCVVERSAKGEARARWIDWGAASVGHDCAGVKACGELAHAANEMGLTRENWTTTRTVLKREGLRI